MFNKKKFKSEIIAESAHGTRSTHVTSLPIPSSTLLKKSVIYNSKKIFNHLPLEIRKINCDKRFKSRVKKLLIDKAYYSVMEFLNDTF